MRMIVFSAYLQCLTGHWFAKTYVDISRGYRGDRPRPEPVSRPSKALMSAPFNVRQIMARLAASPLWSIPRTWPAVYTGYRRKKAVRSNHPKTTPHGRAGRNSAMGSNHSARVQLGTPAVSSGGVDYRHEHRMIGPVPRVPEKARGHRDVRHSGNRVSEPDESASEWREAIGKQITTSVPA